MLPRHCAAALLLLAVGALPCQAFLTSSSPSTVSSRHQQRRSRQSAATSSNGDSDTKKGAAEPPAYFNEPYVDPKTGRTVVDVSDLGLNMEDVGRDFLTGEAVHPAPGDNSGMDSSAYVLHNGNIDWDSMARDLADSDE